MLATMTPSCPTKMASYSMAFLSQSLLSSIILYKSKQGQAIYNQYLKIQTLIMKDNKAARSKRGAMVINLIETPAGYSVIEGTELFNKVQSVSAVSTVQQAPVSSPAPIVVPPTVPIAKEPSKMAIKQNNLLFLKSPTIFNREPFDSESKIPEERINNECKSFATWFHPNYVAEIERNEVLSWVKEWNSQKLDQNAQKAWLEKYKQHRNIIVQIYSDQFAQSKLYLSASAIRKHISEDARWLMKIHVFLTSWGIINNGKINIQNESFVPSNLFVLRKSGDYDVLGLTSSFYSSKPIKSQIKSTEPQNFIALKKATKAIRPYCDYCGIHCQIVWFQHTRTVDPKQISTIMKNVNTKNPPLSEKQYEIILCAKCYCNGNFPLLLTHHDFKKVSVNDKIEPGKKKKSGKNKRKEKKQKMKQKHLEEEEEEKEDVEDGDDEGGRKGKEKQKEKEKEKQEEDHEMDEEKESGQKDRKGSSIPINGTKDGKVLHLNQPKNANEPQRQTNVAEIIKEIVTSAKRERVWSFAETKRLLKLIEEHGEDWDLVYKNMVKSGYCYDCEPEDLIMYFVRLPQMDVSSLIEQNSNESFINENKNEYRSNFLQKKVQRNFDNSVKLSLMLKDVKREPIPMKKEWKELMNKFVNLHMVKINEKIKTLTQLNKKSLKEQRKFDEATKEISDI